MSTAPGVSFLLVRLAVKNDIWEGIFFPSLNILDQAVYERLLADIDARLLRLESGEEVKTTEAQPVATNGD